MKSTIKYKINICDNDDKITSINYLGQNLLGVVYENRSYTAAWLKVHSLMDGSFLWEKRIEDAVSGGTRPIYDDQNIYIPYGNARLTANDPVTGAERWKAPISTLLCSPLAQTAEHIMEVNSDNGNYRIINKANGATTSKGKLKHKHHRYIKAIYPWGDNFLAIGEARAKPVLGVYAPDGFMQNIALPSNKLIRQEYAWLFDNMFHESAVSYVVGDYLYLGTFIGNLYQFNLTTETFESKFSLNPHFDPAIFTNSPNPVKVGPPDGVIPVYNYSDMVVVGNHIYFMTEEFPPKEKVIRHTCKWNLETGELLSTVAPLKVIDCATNPKLPYITLQVLENGMGVYLSENGLVTFSLLDNSTSEAVLEGWADVIKCAYRKGTFTGLAQFKYGKHWLIQNGKLLVMPLNSGELYCWEL